MTNIDKRNLKNALQRVSRLRIEQLDALSKVLVGEESFYSKEKAVKSAATALQDPRALLMEYARKLTEAQECELPTDYQPNQSDLYDLKSVASALQAYAESIGVRLTIKPAPVVGRIDLKNPPKRGFGKGF